MGGGFLVGCNANLKRRSSCFMLSTESCICFWISAKSARDTSNLSASVSVVGVFNFQPLSDLCGFLLLRMIVDSPR